MIRFLKSSTEAEIYHAKKPTEALEFISEPNKITLLITDLFLPEKKGLELIQKGIGANPAVVPIAIIPGGDRTCIIEALQAGTCYYIQTPYYEQEILEVVKNALEHQRLLQISLQRNLRLRKHDGFLGIIGESSPMKKLFKTMEQISASNYGNVLLWGESGTGKELVARAIHDLTPERNRYSFVPVNCAAIPEELLESELFGYEKGAFTGANRAKKGRLQHADHGTLFLDEIGDMKPGMQAKLLRVLQEHAFEPIGSVHTIEVDIRVIAASNQNLKEAVKNGTFREDLYYRLSVVPINLPPLRKRTEDIPQLIEKFLLMYNRGRRNAPLGFTDRATERLKAYDWPGNVRELQNLVQRMCILHSEDTVDADALPKKFRSAEEPAAETANPGGKPDVKIENNPGEQAMDFHAMTSEYEAQLILKALSATGWNKKEAARLLNMKRTTLLEKIKKKKLDREN
ncbi:MAG: sigma-54 dependent transcriptional regulator [Desulfobacteraceae bacterium]|nr:sigma-54 dependent transcriptional regulator [Desulfobacteraceae bacterium]MCF8094279.1 sigma-54 dependent transcriptional regulator [Desulfobacteraceae bacterium]